MYAPANSDGRTRSTEDQLQLQWAENRQEQGCKNKIQAAVKAQVRQGPDSFTLWPSSVGESISVFELWLSRPTRNWLIRRKRRVPSFKVTRLEMHVLPSRSGDSTWLCRCRDRCIAGPLRVCHRRPPSFPREKTQP